jgi:hypothetical protein
MIIGGSSRAAVKSAAVPVAHAAAAGGQTVRRTLLQAVGHQCLECYDPFTCFRHISCLGTHDVLQHILEYVPTYSHTLLRMIHQTLFLQVQGGTAAAKATPKTNANANVQKPKTFTLPYIGMNIGGSRYSDCDSDSDDSSDSNDDSESDVFGDSEDDNGVNFGSHEQLNDDARFAGSMVQEEILSNNSVSPPTPVASNSEASPTTPRTELNSLNSYELKRERRIERHERRLRELGLLKPMEKKSPKKRRVKKIWQQVKEYSTRKKKLVSRTHQYRISLINILLSICILYDNLQTKETSSTTSDQPSSSRKQVEVNVQVEVKRIVELHCITKSSLTSHI